MAKHMNSVISTLLGLFALLLTNSALAQPSVKVRNLNVLAATDLHFVFLQPIDDKLIITSSDLGRGFQSGPNTYDIVGLPGQSILPGNMTTLYFLAFFQGTARVGRNTLSSVTWTPPELTILPEFFLPPGPGRPVGQWLNLQQLDAQNISVGSAPEPAEWLLLIGGFCMIGVILRRERSLGRSHVRPAA